MKKKQLSLILCLGFIATLFMLGVVILSTLKTAPYIKVKATLINVSSERQSGHSASHWVTYEYNIDGHNYQGTRQVFSKLGKKIGKTKYIKYNPNNPEELENTLIKVSGIAFTIFFAIFSIGLLISVKKGFHPRTAYTTSNQGIKDSRFPGRLR